TNSVHRKAMGAWLERVVFSTPGTQLPFATNDYRTRRVDLSEDNFKLALQASCSIPFVMRSVDNVHGGPPGAYWDGGITDYHLHLNYASDLIAASQGADWARGQKDSKPAGLVLYPHFQKSVVPGWLDKGLKWRHKATHFLDNMVLLAPDPEWISKLPNAKLPDRTDFVRYGPDMQGRVKAWSAATAASAQLAEEWRAWLARPDLGQLGAL
ncbi:MAG: phospholipase, partial [Polaromonas sp.]|nr:phospholipase [Polaromonas sp.]